MQTSQTQLDELDEFLSSEASPEGCMQLSDLDGFLTGIAIGPELIKPSEWLPVIWGDDTPDFENVELAELIYGIIIDRYNEILQSLAADPPQLNPIFWQTEDGTVIASDWAEGFMAATRLRPVEWAALLNDENACLPFSPIVALVEAEEIDPAAVGSADRRVQLIADAANLIPSSVIEIDAHWKARRGSVS